ncbi:MAG TPA: ectonucleotide pyrophosphatase/phosphodiesterase [Vicinamibacterales bacterium]|nr:ectonucleotide pyrophosphatase/phosphodiesterase [Vicinamibacterales bacterium]
MIRLTSTALLILLSFGCGRPHLVLAPTGPDATFVESRPDDSVTRNVVLVSIDGLRPDAIAAFKAPTLSKLVAEGSYTLSATTIVPSKTLPSHTSMLTGEPPDRHGVLWNDAFNDQPGTLKIPTIFGAARSRGYRTAAFFSKSKFSHLQVPGTLDYSQSPGGWFGRWSSSSTLNDVEKHLASAAPNLLFVHLTDPDAEGHSHGWMSREYGRGVLRADLAVERLLRAADKAYGVGEYTVIVTADHGGNGRDHGSDHAFDVTIPWIAWGRGVLPGEIVSTKVTTMDTASTVLFLLGLDKPAEWAGVPIRRAFTVAIDD